MRLEGKVAIITGSASGIGAASARLFAGEGAKVCIADIDEEKGRQVAADITESCGDAFFQRLDIISEDDWAEGVNEVVARYGKINVLVNCAAAAHYAKVEETTVEDWDHVMAVNGKGTFLGTREVIPHMRRAGGGSIINISSGAGLVGQAWSAALQRFQGRGPPAGKMHGDTVRPRRHQVQLGPPRCHRHPDAPRRHSTDRRFRSIRQAHGPNGHPGRDRLRRPLPSIRRI